MVAFRHGAGGYRRHKCRCEVCRAGHAAEQRVQRTKAVDRKPISQFPVRSARPIDDAPVTTESGTASKESNAGSTEAKTARQIEDLAAASKAWSSECARLEDQALTAARIVDTVIADGRVHLAPAHFRLLNNTLDRLQEILFKEQPERRKEGTEGDDFDLWLEAIHTPSVRCQPAFPAVIQGVCEDCDHAVIARRTYGLRHPDKPAHEYGTPRTTCGCQQCVAELAAAAASVPQAAGDDQKL